MPSANVFIMGPKQRSRRSMRFVVVAVVVDGAFNFLQGEQVARQVVREQQQQRRRQKKREIRLLYYYYYYYWGTERERERARGLLLLLIVHLMLYNCYCCCLSLVFPEKPQTALCIPLSRSTTHTPPSQCHPQIEST